MSKKISGRGGASFTIHPANLDIETYTAQHIYLKNGQAIVGSSLVAATHTGVITLTDPQVSADQYPSEILLGEYTLVEGIHWVVDITDAAATAAGLTSAINNLDGFSATLNGLDVEIETTSIENVAFVLKSRTGNMSVSPERGILTASLDYKVTPPDIT